MRLLLNDGGHGEKTISAIRKLNEIIDHSKPILYIPLAMDEVKHPYGGCYEFIQGELSIVDVPTIDMVRTFKDLASKNLYYYSAIFMGGGNTYKLLKGLKESSAFENIREYIINDGIVFGSSARTVIFGEDIAVIASVDSNDVDLIDTKGFNIFDGISIFPHYTNKKSKLTEEQNVERHNNFTKSILDFSLSGGSVFAYSEEDTVYVNGEIVEIIGDRDYFFYNRWKYSYL